MSAYIVPKVQIDALVMGAEFFRQQAYGPFKYRFQGERKTLGVDVSVQEFGQILWNENYKSVNALYDEKDEAPIYQFSRLPGSPSLAKIAAAVRNYEYQSCEHPDWQKSEAYAICESMRESIVRQVSSGDWGVDGPDYFLTEEQRKVFAGKVA